MVKLLGLFKFLPKDAVILLISFFGGYFYGIYNLESDEQEAYIQQLEKDIATKNSNIKDLTEKLEADSHKQLAITDTIERLQHNLSEANRKLSESSSRASEVRCRELLSESADLHREGLRLLRDADRKLKSISIITP